MPANVLTAIHLYFSVDESEDISCVAPPDLEHPPTRGHTNLAPRPMLTMTPRPTSSASCELFRLAHCT